MFILVFNFVSLVFRKIYILIVLVTFALIQLLKFLYNPIFLFNLLLSNTTLLTLKYCLYNNQWAYSTFSLFLPTPILAALFLLSKSIYLYINFLPILIFINLIFYFFNKFIYFYFWLRWVFIAMCRLSLVAASGGYSSLWCAGFSCCRAWALGVRASVVVAHGLSSCGLQALERGLSSCGSWA